MSGTVLLHIDGAVATLTLDNRAKRNSIDLALCAALTGAARAIAEGRAPSDLREIRRHAHESPEMIEKLAAVAAGRVKG